MTIDTITGSPANPTPPMTLITMIGDQGIPGNTYVNEYSAMTVPAFWSGVRFLCDTFASFGMNVNQDVGGSRGYAPHRLNALLSRTMSNFATAYQTLRAWKHHANVWGNGYLWIKRDAALRPIALLNLNPEITVPFLHAGEKYYYVGFQEPIALAAADVCHLSLIGFDGIRGYPLVQMMRQSLEIGKHAEKYTANYFKKGSFVKGSIELPGVLTDPQFATLRESLRNYKGLDGENSLDYMILQAGGVLKNSTIPNETSQLIETRKFSVVEVCQMLRIPPHIVYELTHGKWSSVQQMGAEVVKYTFSPWIVQAEQELTTKLLSQTEQEAGLYIRIRTDSLLRGDQQELTTQVLSAVNGGLMTLNEGRALLELPSVGVDGDKFRVPVSFPTAPGGGAGVITGVTSPDGAADDSTSAPDSADAPESPGTGSSGSVEEAIGLPGTAVIDPNSRPASYEAVAEPLLLDAVNRVEAKADKAFTNRANKPADELIPWANVFASEQQDYCADALAPIAAVAQQFGKTLDVTRIAHRYADEIKRRGSGKAKERLSEIVKEVVNA